MTLMYIFHNCSTSSIDNHFESRGTMNTYFPLKIIGQASVFKREINYILNNSGGEKWLFTRRAKCNYKI